jgi:hypothetical protein
MFFTILRRERHLWPIILVPMCVPYAFIWYYQDRSPKWEAQKRAGEHSISGT